MKKESARPLTKELIISTAIAIVDKGGISALSMRSLAKQLNVEAMSLYHHMKNKDDLINQMVDSLISRIELCGETNGWYEIMFNRAISAKKLFQSHPWLPFLIDTQIESGIERLQYLEKMLATLRLAGFSVELTLRAISLIDSYIYGYCRQISHVKNDDKTRQENAERFSDNLPRGDFPFLSEMAAHVAESGYDENTDFLFGLNLVLSGLQRELNSAAGEFAQ